MGKKSSLLEVDPLCLPVGTLVGPWRVLGWRGRGTYGTIYRVEQVGREWAGSFALKLAIHPGDARFQREGHLLYRIHSPHVPRLEDQGVWVHPSGAFPFLVMEWIAGEPLYDWAARRNPTSRQVLRLLAQGARALQATHEAGGLHRDVKGDNVLMRPADGHVFLMDFGAGHYRGAATLTTKLLPPGTPAYRSPESWAFLHVFRRHPTVHYPASTCDDLFALGVTAYRLVADEYPPLTHPEEPGAEVWREGGPGPRPPRELNPRVSPKLDALIRRLLATAPCVRFEGRAADAAQALEQAAENSGPEADEPLFSWGHQPPPRWRSPEEVHLIEDQDAAAGEDLALPKVDAQTHAAHGQQGSPQASVSVWGAEMTVALLALLLAGLAVALLHRGPKEAQITAGTGLHNGDIVAVGDSAGTAPASTLAPMHPNSRASAVEATLPEEPFPGQRTPPCNRNGEVELRGGCWYALRDARLPCTEDAYEWKGACYLPSYPTRRQPTTHPP